MKKFFWIAVGVGITVLVITKGKEIARRATPAGVAEQASKIGRSLEHRVTDFVHTVQENMAIREAELRDALDIESSAQ